jgi:enterobactin synthetase component F
VVSVRPFDLVPDLPGASSELHVLGTGPVDDLTMTLRADPSAHALRITFDANPALYSDRDVAEHIRSLAAFFESAIGAPTVRAIPLR